jgi:bacterioferritin-associated ferredoxin
MAVTRCVCREVSFTVVARAAQSLRDAGYPVTLEAIADLTTAGTGCGTCKPYLARAALTGQTILPVMGGAECTAWIGRLEEPARSARAESGNIPG